MQFSDEQILKFKELYRNRFGIELDRQEAFELAAKCFRAIELTYRQISVSDLKDIEERRKLAEKYFNNH